MSFKDPSVIPSKLIFFYALPMAGAGMLNFLTGTYLMKYATDVLYIGAHTAGVIFLISRIWDAVNDPVCGYLSDHTQSRMGRRRVWIAASALPSALFFYALWNPVSYNALWVGAFLLLFYTALTAFFIPHYSLGAELSADPHQRNRIYGFRAISENIGNFLGVGILQMVLPKPGIADIKTHTAEVMGWGGVFFAAAVIFMVANTPKGKDQRTQKPGIFKAYGRSLRNRHARIILIIGFFSQLGGAAILTMTLYFTQYILKAPGKEALIIGVFMIAATASIPVWIKAAKRFEKRILWAWANAAAGSLFLLTWFLSQGDVWALVILAFLAGGAAGAILMINPSALADTIAHDKHIGNNLNDNSDKENSEGVYFALYTFANKSAMGAAAIIIGAALRLGNYVPNVEQTAGSVFVIKILYCILPAASFFISAYLLSHYEKNKSAY